MLIDFYVSFIMVIVINDQFGFPSLTKLDGALLTMFKRLFYFFIIGFYISRLGLQQKLTLKHEGFVT